MPSPLLLLHRQLQALQALMRARATAVVIIIIPHSRQDSQVEGRQDERLTVNSHRHRKPYLD